MDLVRLLESGLEVAIDLLLASHDVALGIRDAQGRIGGARFDAIAGIDDMGVFTSQSTLISRRASSHRSSLSATTIDRHLGVFLVGDIVEHEPGPGSP